MAPWHTSISIIPRSSHKPWLWDFGKIFIMNDVWLSTSKEFSIVSTSTPRRKRSMRVVTAASQASRKKFYSILQNEERLASHRVCSLQCSNSYH